MNSICRILTTFRGAALRNGLYSGMSPHKTDTIVIDPTGDVLLTLKNPDAGFAVWTQDSAEASIGDLGNAEVQDTDEETDEEDADDEDTLVEEEFVSRSKRKRRTTMDRKDRKRQQRGIFSRTSSSSTIENVSDVPKPAVTYQVSSRHLITASPKFKSDLMLYGEGAKGEDGFFHLSTTDWDPDAFAILLNMLHLRYRHVSRELSLEKLAKVAMLVDYYRCWEAFDLISSVWIEHLRKMYTVPAIYSRELVLWILISWVFKLSPEFTEATGKALRQCKEPCIRDLKLGIPPIILRTYSWTFAITLPNALQKRWNLDVQKPLRKSSPAATAGLKSSAIPISASTIRVRPLSAVPCCSVRSPKG
jgi:hypothetical protein